MKSQHRDRGASTVEVVLVVPVLMFMVMLILQFMMYFNSAKAVRSAAEIGLEAARTAQTNGARQSEGAAATTEALSRFRSNLDGSPVVTVGVEGDATSVGGTRAIVQVTGAKSISVVPGLNIPINVTVSGPVEDVPELQ
jgi:Flp pilus assembly protein TadG